MRKCLAVFGAVHLGFWAFTSIWFVVVKPSRYRGFAALDRRGNLLWGTIKRSKIEAQEAHDRFNPDPTGDGMGEVIVPIQIKLTKPK